MKVALIIIAIVIVLLVLIYAYFGGFKRIEFRVEAQGGEMLVYEDMTGDYGQSGAVTDRVYHALLDDYGIATTQGFGIYYDNPKDVEKSKLRSEVGCIVADLESTTASKLLERFKVKTYPITNCIVTEFPYKGMMSIFVGIMKVYPALAQYAKENGYAGGAVMEIYDVPNKTIIYRQELLESK
ncbi:hypothetical protein AGMMS49982_05880 [Bacteroidia bacterium]|nr:hypothetical protein AGMMS49982_05880 [Bacteroidia bacterium]